MALWERGRCGASFGDNATLRSHHEEVHHERVPAGPVPHSSPVKPLGGATPAPHAQEARTGEARERTPPGWMTSRTRPA